MHIVKEGNLNKYSYEKDAGQKKYSYQKNVIFTRYSYQKNAKAIDKGMKMY